MKCRELRIQFNGLKNVLLFPSASCHRRRRTWNYSTNVKVSNLQTFRAALEGSSHIRDTEPVSHVSGSAVETFLHVKKPPAGSSGLVFVLTFRRRDGNLNHTSFNVLLLAFTSDSTKKSPARLSLALFTVRERVLMLTSMLKLAAAQTGGEV